MWQAKLVKSSIACALETLLLLAKAGPFSKNVGFSAKTPFLVAKTVFLLDNMLCSKNAAFSIEVLLFPVSKPLLLKRLFMAAIPSSTA